MRNVKRKRCVICDKEIDQSACGQFLVTITFNDDTEHKNKHDRAYLCETHARALDTWVQEKQFHEHPDGGFA